MPRAPLLLICGLLFLSSGLSPLGCDNTDGEVAKDSSNETCQALDVYVGASLVECGTACPAGSPEAYRDGSKLACHACQTDADCPSEHPKCETVCGPGCENDTAGCCPVQDCR